MDSQWSAHFYGAIRNEIVLDCGLQTRAQHSECDDGHEQVAHGLTLSAAIDQDTGHVHLDHVLRRWDSASRRSREELNTDPCSAPNCFGEARGSPPETVLLDLPLRDNRGACRPVAARLRWVHPPTRPATGCSATTRMDDA